MNPINKDNILTYAFVNFDTLKLPVKAVCIDFHGYTDATRFTESSRLASDLGNRGIAYVFPYYSVWAWYSKSSRIYNEMVLDAVFDKLGNAPLIVSGGSMGGMTALMYAIEGKRKPVGCVVNCPVTDTELIFENDSIRPAILSAHIEEGLNLKAFSPVCRINDLLDIKYFAVFGGKDECITDKYFLPFNEKMQGKNYEYYIEEQMPHCDISNFENAYVKYRDAIISIAKGE